MIFEADHWRKARKGYVDAARQCKATLTDKDGCWSYDTSDERVKLAMDFWLHRARNAHAFALGRKPVIKNFYYADNNGSYSGELYAYKRTD